MSEQQAHNPRECWCGIDHSRDTPEKRLLSKRRLGSFYLNDVRSLVDRAEAAERELARLRDGMRLTHEFARERLEDGHPGLLDMHLVEDKLRALLADTPEDDQ